MRKITIKKIKEIVKEKGLRIGNSTAKEIKTFIQENKDLTPSQHLGIILEYPRDNKRKTVLLRDVKHHKDLIKMVLEEEKIVDNENGK